MGASEDEIAAVERRLGVRFPDDYRRLLAVRGSVGERMEPAGAYLRIHPVGEVIGVNQAGEIADRFPGAVVIGGDGPRELLCYDFRAAPPPLVLLDITAEDWEDAP
jgi:hypothetical protein